MWGCTPAGSSAHVCVRVSVPEYIGGLRTRPYAGEQHSLIILFCVTALRLKPLSSRFIPVKYVVRWFPVYLPTWATVVMVSVRASSRSQRALSPAAVTPYVCRSIPVDACFCSLLIAHPVSTLGSPRPRVLGRPLI